MTRERGKGVQMSKKQIIEARFPWIYERLVGKIGNMIVSHQEEFAGGLSSKEIQRRLVEEESLEEDISILKESGLRVSVSLVSKMRHETESED